MSESRILFCTVHFPRRFSRFAASKFATSTFGYSAVGNITFGNLTFVKSSILQTLTYKWKLSRRFKTTLFSDTELSSNNIQVYLKLFSWKDCCLFFEKLFDKEEIVGCFWGCAVHMYNNILQHWNYCIVTPLSRQNFAKLFHKKSLVTLPSFGTHDVSILAR